MRSTARAVPGLPLLAVGLFGTGGLHAQGSDSFSARLEWRQEPGAEACLDGESLKRAVNERWGRSVFVDTPSADILLQGSIGHSEATGGWHASLDLRRSDGTSLGSRELVTAAPDCSSLDDSVALAVGLMLDVSRHRVAEERRLTDEHAKRAPEAVLDGPAISIPKETLPRREPFRVEPSIGAETAVGLLPGWGLAARAGLAIVPPRFVRLEAAVAFFLQNDEHAAGGRGARFSAWTAELAICPVSWQKGAIRADACLTERFGQVRAVGFGFAESETAMEPLSAVGLREVATLQLARPLALFLGVGVEAPFVRYRFVFADVTGGARAIYRMPPVMGSGALGLSLEW
jgi:hypothetical protein